MMIREPITAHELQADMAWFDQQVAEHVRPSEHAYSAALEFVDAIEPPGSQRLNGHYRDTAGKLLITLDQVVNAVLSDKLTI